MILIQRQWTSQPPAGRRIAGKWASAVAFAVSGTSPVDMSSGGVAATTGTINQQPTQKGIATFASSASSTRRTWAKKAFTSYNDGYAILCFANPAQSVSAIERAVLIGDEAASAYTSCQLVFNSGYTTLISSGRVAFIEYSSAEKAKCETAALAFDGSWTVFVANRPAGTVAPSLYLNGIDKTSAAIGATGVTTPTGIYIHGAPTSTTTGYVNGGMALTVIFKRPLSVTEIVELSRNPWQIFEPLLITIPAPVAAAAAPTLSALSAINVTSSSAQPRISYTF